MRQLFCILSVVGFLLLNVVAAQEKIPADQEKFFEQRIRPVLVEHCYECHSAESKEPGGKLLLDSRAGLRAGGESGPVVLPGRPSSSLLLTALKYSDPKLAMPPKDAGEKLPDSVIADFERWIRIGAPDPRTDTPAAASKYATEEAKSWWAWQSITNPQVPVVNDQGWARNDIDRFIWASLESAKLQPSADAELTTLVRRLAFDLTGLPPSFEDLQRHALNSSPAPIAELVDKYMDSPQYGERMGRHWLDVARYAESSGKDVNIAFPHAWRYRDYVIDSFNQDLPFDQFILEQLAGDLLKSESTEVAARRTIATGFLALGAKGLGEQNPRQFAVDTADEQIDATSQAFLATTISCARCHDHKFDPISQRDYTAISGIFLSTETHFGSIGGVAGRNRSDLLELPKSFRNPDATRSLTPTQVTQMRERIKTLEEQRRELFAERRNNSNPVNFVQIQQQLVALQTQLEQVDIDGNLKALTMGVTDKEAATPLGPIQQRIARRMQQGPQGPQGRPIPRELLVIHDSPQLVRGEIDKPGDVVPRGLPEFLARDSSVTISRDESGRLQLARWIASSNNPLTARVIVNRVWLWLMGAGLVKSVDNFGTTGDQPSHPELLDYLTQRFLAENWSIKHLVREIVLSHTYAQSSANAENAFLVDPENRLLWRANQRALDAECLRDGMLLASRTLDLSRPNGSLISRSGDGPIGGPGRRIGLSEDQIATANDQHRSVYLPTPRNLLPNSLELFDFADNSVVTGSRSTTIVPSQALYWMNNSDVEDACSELVTELLGSQTGETKFSNVRIAKLFDDLSLRVLSRPALAAEKSAATSYVREHQDEMSQKAVWTRVARTLFASADYRFLK